VWVLDVCWEEMLRVEVKAAVDLAGKVMKMALLNLLTVA
jgi:hypothetical protein